MLAICGVLFFVLLVLGVPIFMSMVVALSLIHI